MKKFKIEKSKNREIYEFLISLGVPTTRISQFAKGMGEKITPCMVWRYKRFLKKERGEENPVKFLQELIEKFFRKVDMKINTESERNFLYLLLLYRLGVNMMNEKKCGVPLPSTDEIIGNMLKVLDGLEDGEGKKVDNMVKKFNFLKDVNNLLNKKWMRKK